MKDPTGFDGFGGNYSNSGFKNNTKERILLESASLFTRDGYFGVSVKDIANAVGIKPASLYNHYESKEALWKAVLDRIQDLYMKFFDSLKKMGSESNSIAEIISNLFLELKESSRMFTFYGISLIQSEQFHSSLAADMYYNLLIKYSIDNIKAQFDDIIASSDKVNFDTQTVATMIMHSFLNMVNARVQEHMGINTLQINVLEQIDSIRDFILSTVQNNILNNGGLKA